MAESVKVIDFESLATQKGHWIWPK